MDNAAKLLALGVENIQSARAATINVACDIYFHAIGPAGLGPRQISKDPVGLLSKQAVRRHIERTDVATPKVVDVQYTFVRLEQGDALSRGVLHPAAVMDIAEQ